MNFHHGSLWPIIFRSIFRSSQKWITVTKSKYSFINLFTTALKILRFPLHFSGFNSCRWEDAIIVEFEVATDLQLEKDRLELFSSLPAVSNIGVRDRFPADTVALRTHELFGTPVALVVETLEDDSFDNNPPTVLREAEDLSYAPCQLEETIFIKRPALDPCTYRRASLN